MALEVVDAMNKEYMQLHEEYEKHFWSTKMGLKGNNRDLLAASKKNLDAFLCDPANLAKVEEAIGNVEGEAKRKREEEQVLAVLKMMEKTFKTYLVTDKRAQELKNLIIDKEQDLAADRGGMKLGYVDPTSGDFVEKSSVQLRNLMRTEKRQDVRKACYEGLKSIGDVVAKKLGQIVKLRNELARVLGYEDFYDLNVSMAEGFSKKALFEKLDALEIPSKELNEKARAMLAKESAADCNPLDPWNSAYVMSGETETEMDPYFPFETAVLTWAESFAGLGIQYRGSTLNLDLLDRQGKYSNGFCHWPVPAHRDAHGNWVPSLANFTSLASPNAVGSGKLALRTLLHEAGHSAHFASVDPFPSVGSPLFSQERAPQSVSYAEAQSMFLDKLIQEGDWLAQYAKNRAGERIPKDLVEKSVRAVHPYKVFDVRRMLQVPYFEKSLYELSDQQLDDPQVIKDLAAQTEMRINGGPSPLPLLAVPHILSAEASCYYHGYVLADMCVYQTRAHFFNTYGSICGNKRVGADLASKVWTPGASKSFLTIVKDLTGESLSAQAWLDELSISVDDKVVQVLEKYDKAIEGESSQNKREQNTNIDLDMRLRIVHGDQVIADSQDDGGIQGVCDKFQTYVKENYQVAAPKL